MTDTPTSEHPEIPEISTSTDGTIVLELAPRHAEVLAKILAHYDVLVTSPETVEYVDGHEHVVHAADGYLAEEWHHTLLLLLTERNRHRTPAIITAAGRHLRAVGGAR